MSTTRYFLILIVLLLQLIGCASQSTRTEVKVAQAMIHADVINMEHRETQAKQLFKENDLYAALIQWQILRAINPENTEYLNRIRVLETLIQRRIKLFLIKGKEALAIDALKVAETHLLKALALDPNNHFALKMMREIEARRVQKVQLAKTQRLKRKQLAKHEEELKRRQRSDNKFSKTMQLTEHDDADEHGIQETYYLDMGRELYQKGDWNGAIREIDKYLSSNKSTPVIQNMLKNAHANIADVFEKRGHWDPAIQHLEVALDNTSDEMDIKKLKYKHQSLQLRAAEYYYAEGVKVYRQNVDRAILFWEQALELNPDHVKAGNRLKKALQIRENLLSINQ